MHIRKYQFRLTHNITHYVTYSADSKLDFAVKIKNVANVGCNIYVFIRDISNG